MFVMEYVYPFIMMLMVVSVVVLSMTLVSYYGVVSLMGFVFLCCVFMSMVGRTFIALVMYIVYLGGLIVVFSYCISVEKDVGDIYKLLFSKLITFLLISIGLVVFLWVACFLGVGGWLVDVSQDCFVRVEVNGFGVLYSDGGIGLMVCSWGLLITLFSILVILSWHRCGGFRAF